MAKAKQEPSKPRTSFSIQAKNEKQKALLYALPRRDCVVVVGPAGSGKTYVPTAWASLEFLAKRVEKLVLVRPNQACGSSLGFFTGDKNEKMMNWLAPIVGTMKSVLTPTLFDKSVIEETIILAPLETIRGNSYNNAIVIVDECQNMTKQELLAILTRIGENSKIIFAGDVLQTDISGSGLAWMLGVIENNAEIREFTEVISFGVEDIVRSRLCKAWVKAAMSKPAKPDVNSWAKENLNHD